MWQRVHDLFNFLHPRHYPGPVRYMFPFVVGFASFVAAVSMSSVSYSYIKIAASETTVAAGDRFSIDIYAYAHVPVNAVDVSLSFSNDAIEVLGIDTGRSVITLWTEEPAVKQNIITLRGGTFKRGFRGEHLIATVTARAKQAGRAEFFISNLSLLAGDGKGTPVVTGTPAQSRIDLMVSAEGEEPAKITANVALEIVTDIDGDGKVTMRDVSAFLSGWHSRTEIYDFNSDGKMTFRDFAIILAESFFGPKKP